MKIVKQVPAFVLSFVFVVFGVLYFFKALPAPPMTGDQLTFMNLFEGSGYLTFIKILEVVFGLLLVFPRTRALGLLLILPIVVNIVCFEVFIAKQPGIGVPLLLINFLGIFFSKEKYQGLLR